MSIAWVQLSRLPFKIKNQQQKLFLFAFSPVTPPRPKSNEMKPQSRKLNIENKSTSKKQMNDEPNKKNKKSNYLKRQPAAAAAYRKTAD